MDNTKLSYFEIAFEDEFEGICLVLVVGIAWNPETDFFLFEVQATGEASDKFKSITDLFAQDLRDIRNKDDILSLVDTWRKTDEDTDLDIGKKLTGMLEKAIDKMEIEHLLEV